MKQCNGCHKIKESTAFHKNAKSPDSLYYICKECVKPISAKNYLANKERLKLFDSSYALKHPGYRAFKARKYQASKLSRTPKWLSLDQYNQIKEFYVLAKELQWLSDPTDPLTVDHIVPLQGKNVSGLHVPWNLQIVPHSTNSAKGNLYEF